MTKSRRKPGKGGVEGAEDIVTRVTMNLGRSGILPSPQELSALADSDPLPEGVRPRLRKVGGPGEAVTANMREAMIMIGRAEGVAEVVVEDDRASRYHACIVHRNGKFFVCDMGSRNGTRLNGQFVSEAEVVSGDEITVGDTVLRFEL